MDKLMADMPGLEDKLNAAKDKQKKVDKKLDRAEKKLEKWENPPDSVTSNGRTITNQDIAINRMVARQAWSRYIAGELTADQLEEEWKNYDEDAREAAKEA
ncbi:hypothetical protein ACFL0V_06280 [Nanoarchaeota archaeon]